MITTNQAYGMRVKPDQRENENEGKFVIGDLIRLFRGEK